MFLHPRQRKVQNLAPDIIEIHIEIAYGFFEIRMEGRALVVDRLVDAQRGFEPVAFVVCACDRDDFGSDHFAELADERTGCACGC